MWRAESRRRQGKLFYGASLMLDAKRARNYIYILDKIYDSHLQWTLPAGYVTS